MITQDYNKFRNRFSEFKDLTGGEIELYYQESRTLISPVENTKVLPNRLRESGIYLATAVIAREYKNISNDNSTGILSSASEGSVSLSYQPIPYRNMKEYDLLANDLQPYGKILLRIINSSQPEIVTNTGITNSYYNTAKGY